MNSAAGRRGARDLWSASLAAILARSSSERTRLTAATASRLSAQLPSGEVVRTGTGSCAGVGGLGSMTTLPVPVEACDLGAGSVIAGVEGSGGGATCRTEADPPAPRAVGGLLPEDSLRISASVLPVSSGGGGNTEACWAHCHLRNMRQPTQQRRATTAEPVLNFV